MIVYHGSNIEVIEIDLSKSKAGLDFGKGFYVTCIKEQAEIWAKKRSEWMGGDPIVSGFEFKRENVFSNPYYKTIYFEEYTDEWLDFILLNRNNETDTQAHDYDIVEGPLADDTVVLIVRDFEKKLITREELFKELKFKKVTHQICFCTIKSLDAIERVNLKALSNIEHIGISVISHLVVNDGLSVVDSEDMYYQSNTYAKVSDESTLLYQKPWQEIYDILKKELENINNNTRQILY